MAHIHLDLAEAALQMTQRNMRARVSLTEDALAAIRGAAS